MEYGFTGCVRCGLPESHQNHSSETCDRNVGWHPYRGQDYLDGLEEALLSAYENPKRRHKWKPTGIWIPVGKPFKELYCKICGDKNWGGHKKGLCFGNHHALMGIIAAHNRRAIASWSVKLTVIEATDNADDTD